MNNNLEPHIERFNNLKQSHRVLACFVVIVLLFMCFDIFWFSNNSKNIAQSNSTLTTIDRQTKALIDQQKNKNLSASIQRKNPKQLVLDRLNEKIDSVKTKLSERTLNLVQPEEMASVLKDIIDSTKNLKIQSLSKLATTPLSTTNENESQDMVQLYRHSMEVFLTGNYTATHEFLNRLETMEKKVAFDQFEYKVRRYPVAEIRLTVSTLSLNKEWIGG